MSATQLSLLEPSNARARKHDPRTAKRAAALNPEGRATQAARILRYLWEFDRITADQAHRRLTLDGEDVTRGEWSTRIGVLMHRGLVEKAGEVDELDRRGRPRAVLAYRLTPAGHAECSLMFGGVS